MWHLDLAPDGLHTVCSVLFNAYINLLELSNPLNNLP